MDIHKPIPRRPILLAAALGAAALPRAGAAQQDYPTRPIRLVIPNPPGGTSDLLGRAIANHLAERLGQTVVPDNRSGAGGIIPAEFVARAAPDGYTLLIGNIGPNAINKSLYQRLPYDPAADFTPITLAVRVPNVLVLHPSVPARSVRELIEIARARPGELTFASSGSGQSPHLSGEWFASAAGVRMTHVPYRGAAPSMQDLLAGNVNMIFENITNALPHIRAGALRALAVTSARRSSALPELPTIAEAAGLEGYDVSSWFGMFGPAGMPRPVVDRLSTEIRAYLALPATRETLSRLGAEVAGGTPEEFAAFVRAEIAKWAAVIERAGIARL
jgi:tripartite-type tricarboxylate transporter receptor subunit TctC